MNRILLPVAILCTLVVGCGRAAVSTQANTPSKHDALAAEEHAVAESQTLDRKETNAAHVSAPTRTVGDYVVYMFSGDFRSAPVLLIERVVSQEKSIVVLELTLSEGASKQHLRVHMGTDPEHQGEVLAVSRVEEGVEKKLRIEEYEQLMAKTMLMADQNEELLGTEELTLKVGGVDFPCKKITYRVKIGEQSAVLHTIGSEKFPWGDVAGEIRTSDGRVLYRAEVVELGHGELPKTMSGTIVAQSDYDDYE